MHDSVANNPRNRPSFYALVRSDGEHHVTRSGNRIECDFSGWVELGGSDFGLERGTKTVKGARSQARDRVGRLEKVLGVESE